MCFLLLLTRCDASPSQVNAVAHIIITLTRRMGGGLIVGQAEPFVVIRYCSLLSYLLHKALEYVKANWSSLIKGCKTPLVDRQLLHHSPMVKLLFFSCACNLLTLFETAG